MCISFDPESLFLTLYPTEIHIPVSKDRCTRKFITAFFVKLKNKTTKMPISEGLAKYIVVDPQSGLGSNVCVSTWKGL